MSCRMVPVSVRASITRRQLRVALSPAGTHPSLPVSQSELDCQEGDRTRLSLVWSVTAEPACGASGGLLQTRIGSVRVDSSTPPGPPGTPVSVKIFRVVPVFIARKAEFPLVWAWLGHGELRVGSGGTRWTVIGAHDSRSNFFTT